MFLTKPCKILPFSKGETRQKKKPSKTAPAVYMFDANNISARSYVRHQVLMAAG